MNRTAETALLTLPRISFQNAILKDGETVSVRLLSPPENGKALVLIKGQQIEASVLQNLKKGDILRVTVAIKESTVFLSPQKETFTEQTQPLFQQLGLPVTEANVALLSTLQTIQSKDMPQILSQLAARIKKLPQNQKEAAFLLGILKDRKIDLHDEVFSLILGLLTGNADDHSKNKANQDDSDIFKLINHKKGSHLHWIVIPFQKELAAKTWKGSLALLLNLPKNTCEELVLRAKTDTACWIFVLKGTDCYIENAAETKLSKTKKTAYCRLLQHELQALGLKNIRVEYGISSKSAYFPLAGIDISV
ncbi:hypothetical protein [Treponema phagedenis]|uniref:hypothetical protein n=1 Tax=Treponema phagedenis TaxID=162 RepID=UPI0011E81C3F|nr:hypothetical protein [Treponema phagedenis]NVP23441.1 hypothetical protein [Treponema phagedenis]QEJ95657.1 hypothetical protein FUT79_10865 [Treponema phagedenis]QEK04087.1 hypothetical protein FUT83_09930 [Treponema phagedenis]QEK09702.1 hypothetical protein FUT81_09835 [Treponema phagedenis]QKS92877.1 hypothetical protein HPJ96_10170 [Treponema phagedenis]